MFDPGTIGVIAFIILAASFLQGLTGFGFALMTTPLLLLVMANPKDVVILNVALCPLQALLITWQSRRYLEGSKVWLLFLPSLPGILLGTYIIKIISPSALKLSVAALCIVFAIPLLLGYSRQIKREGLGLGIAGFISGVLSPSTSLGGPPIVLFLANQGWAKELLRATMSAVIFLRMTVSMAVLWLAGLVATPVLFLALGLMPVTIIGTYLGSGLMPRIKSEVFRSVAVVIIIASALAAIVVELFR